jgi:hypothetical protein
MKSCHEIPFKVPQQRLAQMKNGRRRWFIMQQALGTSLIWRIQSLLVQVVFVGDGAVIFFTASKTWVVGVAAHRQPLASGLE